MNDLPKEPGLYWATYFGRPVLLRVWGEEPYLRAEFVEVGSRFGKCHSKSSQLSELEYVVPVSPPDPGTPRVPVRT